MKKYSIESQQNTKRLFTHNISKKSANSNFVFDQPKTKKSKSLINLILFFLVISLVIIIYFFFQWIINYDKTATLDYYLAPSTATVVINEKPLKSDGKIKLKPGTYTIKVSQPGFIEISKNIELKIIIRITQPKNHVHNISPILKLTLNVRVIQKAIQSSK